MTSDVDISREAVEALAFAARDLCADDHQVFCTLRALRDALDEAENGRDAAEQDRNDLAARVEMQREALERMFRACGETQQEESVPYRIMCAWEACFPLSQGVRAPWDRSLPSPPKQEEG